LADLEGVCGCSGEKGSPSAVGLRRACGATWGLRLKEVHWLYVSVIWPSITCASLVWWSGCQMAEAKKTLSRVQRFAFLGIMGAIHTTPTGA